MAMLESVCWLVLVLAGPCTGLLQRVAAHLCANLTVFLKPTGFFHAVAWEFKSKLSHPLWVQRSLTRLLCQTLGQPLVWGG